MTESLSNTRPWRTASLSTRPVVMGILNVTPDSFSDGGRYDTLERAVTHGLQMVEEGADVLDIGGESTRPGAASVSVDEELARTVPVIERLRAACDVPLSIDTSKPQVMRDAVGAGATLINDVNALQTDGALAAAASLDADVCLMHRQGTAATMQASPHYDDVVADVLAFLLARAAACEAAGIARAALMIDPGYGFGKTARHNLQLLQGLGEFVATGLPVLAGLSRKSLLQTVTGRNVDERLAGSVALATLAADRGARVLRVHDVAATVDAMNVVHAVHDVTKTTN
ncbi:MAG: dihydropteroate synthase [Gammaproteobacteria bacterium]